MNAPTSDRPAIPQVYGIDESPEGMLSWEDVLAAIERAELYWVATALPSGEPHLIPIHAATVDGLIHLSGDQNTRWARNLASRSFIQIGLEHERLQVMVRGVARLETPDRETFAVLNANIAKKYDWQFESDPIPVWIVQPRSVIGFDLDRFASSPTRFTFQESQ